MGIGVSDPPNVAPDSVVSVSTSPVELDLIGLGVSPVDVAVVEVVEEVVVERKIGVPEGF